MLSEAVTQEQIDLSSREGIEPVFSVYGPHAASAVAVMTLAFAGDPVARWSYPEPDDFLRHFPDFVRAMAGRSFERGTAYLAPDAGGAALWLPPGAGPDEDAMLGVIWSSTSDAVQRDLFPMLEQMEAAHPREPHWYLPMIGVEPGRQGKGIGAALLQHSLAICDGEGLPAYLESTNPRNISLYERFGFKLRGVIQVGSAPPLYPMYREAARA